MECTLENRSVKTFFHMIKCVYSIGDDLFVETTNKEDKKEGKDASEDAVLLRALNPSHSAFVAFKLARPFFKDLELKDDVGVHCQVGSKTVLSTFKAFTQIESMTIDIASELNKVTLHHTCKHSIKKRYTLALQECEVMQAVFDKASCKHHIKCSPRLLNEYIQNFPSSVEEISFVATPDSLQIENFVDRSKTKEEIAGMLETSLAVSVADLEMFEVDDEVTVTFCLREFKAALTFCDSQNETMEIHFDCSSRPLLVNVVTDDGVHADFVIATLYDAESDSEFSSQATQPIQSQPAISAIASSSDRGAREKITPASSYGRSSIASSAGTPPTFQRRHADNGADAADVEMDALLDATNPANSKHIPATNGSAGLLSPAMVSPATHAKHALAPSSSSPSIPRAKRPQHSVPTSSHLPRANTTSSHHTPDLSPIDRPHGSPQPANDSESRADAQSRVQSLESIDLSHNIAQHGTTAGSGRAPVTDLTHEDSDSGDDLVEGSP